MEKYTLGKYKQNKFKNLVAILTLNTWTLRQKQLLMIERVITSKG